MGLGPARNPYMKFQEDRFEEAELTMNAAANLLVDLKMKELNGFLIIFNKRYHHDGNILISAFCSWILDTHSGRIYERQ